MLESRLNAGRFFKLGAEIKVNKWDVPLNNFTQRYIKNVVKGIVSSFGYRGKEIQIYLDFRAKTHKKDILIKVDDNEIVFGDDPSRYLVIGTLKGMLSSIKGIPFFENVHILIH